MQNKIKSALLLASVTLSVSAFSGEAIYLGGGVFTVAQQDTKPTPPSSVALLTPLVSLQPGQPVGVTVVISSIMPGFNGAPDDLLARLEISCPKADKDAGYPFVYNIAISKGQILGSAVIMANSPCEQGSYHLSISKFNVIGEFASIQIK